MSTKPATKTNISENDPRRFEQLKKRRAHYKTPEFHEAITDAFHKAKLHALDDQAMTEEKPNPANSTR